MTKFINIDKSTWKRTQYFDHYFNKLRCSYSMTVNLDITKFKSTADTNGIKLYPLLIYALTNIVNRHEEFRTDIDSNGEIGIWESMLPSFTIFHKESETFSQMWTEYDSDVATFISTFNDDMRLFGNCEGIIAKPDTPKNSFPISSIPWSTFTSFNLNIFEDGSYLLPIFTWGKSYIDPSTSKLLIPLSVQVHHAVCDGFHLSRFINELQELLDNIKCKIKYGKQTDSSYL